MSATINHFLNLATPGIQALQPYQPGKPVAELEREYGITDAVKLASNENPFGPSPLALADAREILEDLSRYPEGSGWLLAGRLAGLDALERDRVTLGNGSNDVLVVIDGGNNDYPDPARPGREGSKAVLNAFEIKQLAR